MFAAPRTMPVSTPVRLMSLATLSALGAAAGLVPGWRAELAARAVELAGDASAAEADMPTEAAAAQTAAQKTKARRARERLVTR
jgi:hypothetical protein